MKIDQVLNPIQGGAGSMLSDRPLSLDRDKLETWLMFRGETLVDALSLFVLGGHGPGARGLPSGTVVTPLGRFNGYSGYEYRLGSDCRAQVGFAPLRWGGFALHKTFADSEGRKETWELYSENGTLQSVDSALFLDLLYLDTTEMDPRCPILSHAYNYLAHEYQQARTGQAKPSQIRLMEALVRQAPLGPLHRDPAILAVWERATEVERDRVLGWEERQTVLDHVFADRERIVQTKLRAHKRGPFPASLMLKWGDWANRARRVAMRPGSNIKGFSYKYTIGVMIWFLKTVRGNIGYSMALAIYGPFTFYFITQPLNPHAMWAVGRVRAAYLETTQAVSNLVSGGAATVAAVGGTAAGIAAPDQSAPVAPPVNQQLAYPAEDPSKHLGLPLSTDFKDIDTQSWGDRMSSFKNMQIGYESNMEFAARMGRLEQMELQLNFSMIVDSTWEETERYLDQLESIKASLPQAQKAASPELVRFLDDEAVRTRRIEMYVWDKLLRYILDHPYVVMDESKEQVYRDYYMGRSIILLRDMTKKLAAREQGFKKPADFKRLEQVAAAFEKTRVEGATIMDRLRANSRLFAQADHTDGTELRAFMKRQWEILYLLQNKAQEAGNFGLQAYTWSVRNAVWLLQSLYSAKRRELSLLFESPTKPKDQVKREIQGQIEPLYEQLTHMMSLEFASIRPEMSQKLEDDVDWRQRKVVIDSVEAFLADRERVLTGMIQ